VVKHCEKRGRDFDEIFISYICYCAIHGIRFLHENKTIHRDVKSDNVLFNYKGEVKLADFGASISLTSQHSTTTDQVGTTLYMAPELCQGTPYSFPVDIWSFGILCVELANLLRPHAEVRPYPETPQMILDLIKKKGVPQLTHSRAWSKQFIAFVGRCL
jgi:serine/threonine protein kinase